MRGALVGERQRGANESRTSLASEMPVSRGPNWRVAAVDRVAGRRGLGNASGEASPRRFIIEPTATDYRISD